MFTMVYRVIKGFSRISAGISQQSVNITGFPHNIHPFDEYSKALRYADFGSRKKPCSSKPHFIRFMSVY